MPKSCFFKFKDKKIELKNKTYVMGILNVTPDSFSDGGEHFSPEDALKSALDMEKSGADFIDIGGQSTRPGATPVSKEEEWSRLSEVLPLILSNTKLPVSVDTFYPFVAEKALALGCHIINDVSGRVNPKMAEVVKKYSAGWVLMHSGEEKGNVCKAVSRKLSKMLKEAVRLGVKKESICLDVGIGFGKTYEQNLTLIKNLQKVKVKGNAFLLGVSRKRVIGDSVNYKTSANSRDFGTIAANTIGVLGGADIIRVHNVAAAVQAVQVTDKILNCKG